ncbi:major facilitator superfamily domain-containing protein [Pyrenochaeta sp. MPI-SDFR-AT-0127]|nr:major facilitator superfamily domain-containing protein [Pyrenochaeta sp. MPI-SDFR-AT-0127]
MQQNSVESHDDPLFWPPGTVTLEELQHSLDGAEESFQVVLVPTPTNDPNDPLNWKPWEKYLNYALTMLYSSIVFALISAITPTWAPMNIELGFSYEALNNSYATGSATLAIGALIFIPFALKYGRRPIYLLSLLGQFLVAIWAAKMTKAVELYLTQAFNCLLGALAEVIVQMTIADVFFVHERGLMNVLYVCTMTIGTSLSALIAGYITVGQGWRWVWWWVAIIVGICLLLFMFLYEETKYVARIDGVSDITTRSSTTEDQHTKMLDHKSGDDQINPVSSITTATIPPRKSYLQRLRLISTTKGSLKQLAHHSYQPIFVMCTIPAVTYVALLYGIVTAALQVGITLVATYMPAPPYNFDASQVGLMSLPPFIGNILGAILSAPFADRIILYLSRKNKGIYEPEMRLWLLLAYAPFFSGGLLLFGYGLGKGMSWPVVAVGSGMYSMAMTPISSVALSYITDAYTDIIADSIVGVTFLRNVLATTFVFALTPWVARVGLQNVMLTFGIITFLILGVGTLGMIIYGKRLRRATAGRYRVYAKRQIDSRT